MPVRVASSRFAAPARSAEKPWYFSSLTMLWPTDLMMRSPPTLVPMPIVAEHSSIIQMGMPASPTLVWPLAKATPKKSTPMNFCPSCAPCIKLMAAALAI